MSKQNIQVQVSDKVQELVIREGSAKEIRDPKIVNITGTIDAPAKFMDKRSDLHDGNAVHVTFSKHPEPYIKLVVDEKDHFGTIITGKLKLNPELVEFGINNPNRTYTIGELKGFLKVRRSMFEDRDENMKIVSMLEKFRAEVKSQIEDFKDNKGNMRKLQDKSVKTDLDMTFKLKLPVFVGIDPVTFEVEVCMDIRDSGVTVWLESPELAEISHRAKEQILSSELKNFEDYVVIQV